MSIIPNKGHLWNCRFISIEEMMMGGMFADVFVIYLSKSIVRLFLFFESWRWKRVPASVLDCIAPDPGIGCPLVKIHYQVNSNGDSWAVREEMPFISARDARRYAEKFAENCTINVRVNPTYRTETRFFGFDQK
jgi:hypothetical protein